MESFTVEAILSAVDKNFTSTMKNADNSMGGLNDNTKKTNTSILDIAKGVGVFKLVDSAIGMVKNSLGGAIDRFDTLKQYPNIMRQLGYSTDEVDQSMTKLTEGIDGLPTTLDDIVKNAQSLTMTTGDLDKGTESAIALNNAFLASGASSAEASRGLTQYTQMLAKGKVDMQSWNSLTDTMGLSLEQVANSFGLTGAAAKNDLYDALKEGTITFDQFNNKMIEMYGIGTDGAELAKANSKGVATSIQNLQTAVKNGIAGILEEINLLLGGSEDFNAIAATIDKAKPIITNAFKAIRDAIPPVAEVLSPAIELLSSVFTILKDAVLSASENFQHFFKVLASTDILEKLGATFNNLKDILFGLIKVIESFFGSFELGKTSTSIVEILIGAVSLLVDTFLIVTEKIKDFVEWIDSGSTGADLFKGVIVALGTAIGGIVAYYKIWQTYINLVVKAQKAWNLITKIGTGIQGAFNAVMAINPVILIVGAIAALVAGLIYWITQTESGQKAWQAFTDWLVNAWKGMVDFFQGIWDGIKDAADRAWTAIQDITDRAWIAIQEAPGKAADWIKEKWNSLTGFFSDLWGKVIDTISKAWDNISNTFMGYVEDIMTPFKPLVEWFSGLWENIKTLAASYWEIIKSVIMGPVLFVIDLITGDFEQLKEDVKMIWTTISTNAMTIFTTIKDIITGLVTAVVETAKNLWKLCADYIVGKWNELNSKAQEIWSALKEWLSQTIDNIVEGTKNSWNNLKQGTIDLFNNTVQGAKDIWSSFKEWISNLVTQTKDGVVQGWENLKQGTINIFNRMVNGVQEIWDRLVNAVNDTVGKVTGLFDTLKEINLWEAGKAIMDSFLEGLQNAWKAVQDFVGGIGDWIRENKGPIQYDRKLLIPAGNAIMEGLNKGLTSGFDEVQSTVESMASIITDTFDNSPEIDLASNLQKANSSISTQVEHNVNMGGSTKPAIFNVNLGKQSFRHFVDDIAQAMGEGTEINLEF